MNRFRRCITTIVAQLFALLVLNSAAHAEAPSPSYRDYVANRLATHMAKVTGEEVRTTEEIARIVGGTIAPPKLHKFQVGLYQHVGGGVYVLFCGGTLYKKKYVITAAHCSDGPVLAANVGINAKSRQSDVIGAWSYVTQIVIHPEWNPVTFNHDVAIWKLLTPVDGVPSPPLAKSGPADGAQLKVTGWGMTEEGGQLQFDLRAVEVRKHSRAYCNRQNSYNGAVTKNMFCAGREGKDSCQGDSGGPITRVRSDGKRVLVGIVSWGIGCGRLKYPGVYSRISHPENRDFIIANTP